MKKTLFFILLCCCTCFQAKAVLKEKDLAQTLGVLRAELESSYNEQQLLLSQFKQRNAAQHASLIEIMQKSNQIALMLYSQNSDFTFDMAYACQEATEQYRNIQKYHLPYEKIRERLQSEIDRYDRLIRSLRALPPFLLTEEQLAHIPDSLRRKPLFSEVDSAKIAIFTLDEQGQADRAACIQYAAALRDNYKMLLEEVQADQTHYDRVTKRVGELNDYAQSRYEKIHQSIFVNGGENYFQMIKRLRMHYIRAKKDVDDKYRPLKKASEWRGPIIFGVSIFMLTYIVLATLLSYVIVRWLLPKRIRQNLISQQKRPFLMLAVGVAIFALSIMVAHLFVKQNFILMAINLMITFAWLLEVILFSLLFRLKDQQIRSGILAYTPFILMALLVILFRIVLIPNNVVNLIYPPLLLIFTIWQFVIVKRNIEDLPDSDRVYAIISLLGIVVSCVAAWIGFVLLAVQIMIWWTIQLAVIQTITCLYDMAEIYRSKRLVQKIAQAQKIELKDKNERSKLYKKLKTRIEKGEFIGQSWFFDFIVRAILPVMAVLSVLESVYWASSIFEMNSICQKIFFYVFLDKPGVIQLSVYKICLVIALFFIFRYFNYAIRAFYQMIKRRRLKDLNTPNNITLANNIISIVVWGIFAITALVLLQVPSSGVSIVAAGLATGMGFAMKGLLENFFYGISLMSGRVRVGDYIECDGVQGKVESINYQSTQIVTLDGSVMAFLNTALFNKSFKNLTRNHGYVFLKLPVGVAYGVSVPKVREALVNGLQPLMIKNAHGKNIIDPKHGIDVLFADFGESSVDLFVTCWVLVEEKTVYVCKIKEAIYNTLNEHNIEIPFPKRDVYIKEMTK